MFKRPIQWLRIFLYEQKPIHAACGNNRNSVRVSGHYRENCICELMSALRISQRMFDSFCLLTLEGGSQTRAVKKVPDIFHT